MRPGVGIGTMRYTLAQAEAFYWTARTGGFRAAALRMRLSQPAISLRVRELEHVLGQPLFVRGARGPMLTAFGESILKDVERILSLARDLETRARQDEPAFRDVRIGAAETYATLSLPALLAELGRREPLLRTEITVDLSARLETMLLDGELDVAFIATPHAPQPLALHPLLDIHLVWAVGPAFPAEAATISPKSLVDRPIFTNPMPSNLYLAIQRWFAEHGLKPERLSTCVPISILILLAVAGNGAALVPVDLARQNFHSIPGLRLLAAEPAIAPHTLHAAHRLGDETPDVSLVTLLAKELSCFRPGAIEPTKVRSR